MGANVQFFPQCIIKSPVAQTLIYFWHTMRKLFNTQIFITAGLLLVLTGWIHPYHVNIIEITQHPADSTWEMTVRIFTHEWEESLQEIYGQPTDLGNARDSAVNRQRMELYLSKHILTSLDTIQFQWNWEGYEIKQDETWCYFSCNRKITGKVLRIFAQLLYEHGHGQETIVHFYYNGKRNSNKFHSPKNKTEFNLKP